MYDFDRNEAAAALAVKEKLSARLALMVVDEDPAVQEQNLRELRGAIGAAQGQGDKDKAAKVAALRKAYHEARERRDVQAMISHKHALGQLGVFTV